MKRVIGIMIAVITIVSACLPSVIGEIIEDDTDWVVVAADGDYDEVLNVQNNTKTSFTDWFYKPAGRYVGSMIPQSEFKFSSWLTYSNSIVTVAQEKRFPSEAIMNGASEFYARTPLKNTGYEEGLFYVFKLNETTTYHINGEGELAFSGGCVQMFKLWVNGSDETIHDNNDYYTKEDRQYLKAIIPIIPEERYLFTFVASFPADCDVIAYYVGANDTEFGLINHYGGSPPSSEEFATTAILDWSFIFVQGMGDGVRGLQIYADSWFSLSWGFDVEGSTNGTEVVDYMTIMVPFMTNTTADWTMGITSQKDWGEQYFYSDGPPGGIGPALTDVVDYIMISTDDWNNSARAAGESYDVATISPQGVIGLITYVIYYETSTYIPTITDSDDDLEDYYPDGVSLINGYLGTNLYSGDSWKNTEYGFRLMASEQLTANQYTVGPSYWGFTFPSESEEGDYYSNVYLDWIEPKLEWILDNRVYFNYLLPGAGNAIVSTAMIGDYVIDKYQTDTVFRESVDKYFINPIKSAVKWVWDGIQWVSVNLGLDDIGDWIHDVWIEFKDWVITLWNHIEEVILLNFWFYTLVAATCLITPSLFLYIGSYFIGVLIIKLVISPTNTIHSIANKYGKIKRSIKNGLEGGD